MGHTIGGDGGLFNGRRVKDGTRLENLEVVLAVVGYGRLDGRVARHLELDVERGGTATGVGRRSGHGGEGYEASEELHDEQNNRRVVATV